MSLKLCLLEVIQPTNPSGLWKDLVLSNAVEKALRCHDAIDSTYLSALAEAYDNASSWDVRRQVLSIIADLVPYTTVKEFIPGITDFRIKAARRHKAEYGRGAIVPQTLSPKIRIKDSQLDHFLTFITSSHIIQDLPFGQRFMELSNGNILQTPNVIRAMVPQRIIDQYIQYCKEENHVHFSVSTMRRILAACPASVRKSLQGLDYVAAEGAKAFDDLVLVLQRLSDYDCLQKQELKEIELALKRGKQYLKGDFKVCLNNYDHLAIFITNILLCHAFTQVHVSDSSNCADHCIKHALSDANEGCFKDDDCDHTHQERCGSCDELKSATQSVGNKLLNSTVLSIDDQDELLYIIRQAREAIDAWKAHQLRSIQQDKARVEILERLDETSVFLTNDWAMKFLPQKYRETQADWFAKRGISWHISVVVRQVNAVIQHQTLVHIVKNTTQDAVTVIALVKHTLVQLKKEHPEIVTAFLRQDNAGCYHSVALLTACRHLKESGIKIERVDFSDPQGGKGPCDRKAATIKSHVRRYLNEGNDVTTPEQLYNAMTSNGGISGVRVVLLDNANMTVSMAECNLKGVNSLNNFRYKEERNLVVWKSYNIGDGKEVPWSSVESKLFYAIHSTCENSFVFFCVTNTICALSALTLLVRTWCKKCCIYISSDPR